MNCFKCKMELDWESTYFDIEITENEFKKKAISITSKTACSNCIKEVFG